MKYHHPSKGFIVSNEDLKQVSILLMYTMRMIRQSAGLPLTPLPDYPSGPITLIGSALHAQMDLADALGIDLGATRWHQLDVSASN